MLHRPGLAVHFLGHMVFLPIHKFCLYIDINFGVVVILR